MITTRNNSKPVTLIAASLFALVLSSACAMGQSSINFANNNNCRIINGTTGIPVRAEDGFQAALFCAPVVAPPSSMSQVGPVAAVGKPVPGIFAGGTRVTTDIPAGTEVQVQVRAWPAAFATYQDAVNMGAAVGVSSIITMTTGDAGAQPSTPPPSLTVAGLQGFTTVGLWQKPPTTTNIVLTTPVNTPITIDLATVFAAVSETDGDVVSICAIDAQSACNGVIATTASTLIYTPAANFQGADSFSVRFTDGVGGFAAVPVLVLVSGGVTPTAQQISINCVTGHTVISFGGTPDGNYVIQSAPALTGPWADLSGSLSLGVTGIMGYNDQHTASTMRFYRVIKK
jgi:hypothetical protein